MTLNSPDGLWGFVGGDDGTLSIWELATGSWLHSVKADGLLSAAVSTDGSYSLVGGEDGTVALWDLDAGRCQQRLEGHADSVQAVAMSQRSGTALTASSDGTARVWELDSGRCLRTIESITCAGLGWHDRRIALSTEGRVALSGHEDPRIVRIWDLRRGPRSPWSYTSPRAATDLTGEAEVVHGRLRHASRLIDEGEPAAAIGVLRSARERRGYERNRSLLAQWQRAGRKGRRIGLRDGWYLRDLPADASTSSVALSPDGRLALTSGARGAVTIYEVQTGLPLRTLRDHGLGEGDAQPADVLLSQGDRDRHYARGWSLVVSPEGQLAVSADGWTGTIRVWEIETGRWLRIGKSGRPALDMVAVTPDGRLALTGSRGLSAASGAEAIELWDAQTGSMLRELGDSRQPCAVALSPDGRLGLSSTRGATTISVWDIQSARCVSSLHGHEGSVEAVALSADGRFAVSGGRDLTVRVWELDTRRCLRTLKGHTQPIRSLALSADSTLVISASLDGQVRLWELDWEYDFPAPQDWDESARPHLELFLRTRALLHPGSPLTQEDHEWFAAMIERMGFGWLRRSTVVAELERVWTDQHA